MQAFNDIPALRAAMVAFAIGHGPNLPPAVRDRFASACASLSPAAAICDTAEALYAGQAEIADPASRAAAQTLCAQCAAFGALNGWHGLGDGGRGVGIAWAMRRDLGEAPPAGAAWPAPADDPAPAA